MLYLAIYAIYRICIFSPTVNVRKIEIFIICNIVNLRAKNDMREIDTYKIIRIVCRSNLLHFILRLVFLTCTFGCIFQEVKSKYVRSVCKKLRYKLYSSKSR
jgi:hypothetical protein